jgi:tRNA nucleotidyltransferase (CCA-adding enzyme)
VFFALFPQLEKMVDFNQNTPYHCYDVWEHTLHAMAATPPDFVLQLTMLFHDSGKPETYVEDDDGVGHFPHHGRRSLAITQEALTPLHLPKKTLERVCLLVQHHDLVFQPEERWIKRQLNRFGQEVFFQLLAVHRSDTLAQSDLCRPRLAMLDQCESICQKVLEEQSCFRLQDLAVNGNDLLSLSIPKGQQIGKTLQYLLQMVIDGQCENSREPLLSLAKKWTQISYLHPPILHE